MVSELCYDTANNVWITITLFNFLTYVWLCQVKRHQS